jgi:hypothetical protein
MLGPKRSGFEAEISGFRHTDLLGSFPGLVTVRLLKVMCEEKNHPGSGIQRLCIEG